MHITWNIWDKNMEICTFYIKLFRNFALFSWKYLLQTKWLFHFFNGTSRNCALFWLINVKCFRSCEDSVNKSFFCSKCPSLFHHLAVWEFIEIPSKHLFSIFKIFWVFPYFGWRLVTFFSCLSYTLPTNKLVSGQVPKWISSRREFTTFKSFILDKSD